MPFPLALSESLSLLCSGLFAGAALYITFVEHPARMQCGTTIAITQFAPSYKRATIMQASLAALGTLSAIAAWLQGAPTPWLIAGLLLGAVIPFTLIVILPTNNRLLHPSLDKNSELARQLLQRWATLHAVRSALSVPLSVECLTFFAIIENCPTYLFIPENLTMHKAAARRIARRIAIREVSEEGIRGPSGPCWSQAAQLTFPGS
jgi:hypothetical protein